MASRWWAEAAARDERMARILPKTDERIPWYLERARIARRMAQMMSKQEYVDAAGMAAERAVLQKYQGEMVSAEQLMEAMVARYEARHEATDRWWQIHQKQEDTTTEVGRGRALPEKSG